jgi:ubiquinone/menaquinone biosynthesis C-methylase UbiE
MNVGKVSVSRELGKTFEEILALNDVDLENEADLLLYRLRRNAKIFGGAVCLDAGCGRGEVCYAMGSLGARLVLGIDVGDQISDAKRRNVRNPAVKLVKGDIKTLPLPSNAFDIVHCSGVVHHCANPERTFSELVRVVRPGGLLYVALVGHEGLQFVVTTTMRMLARIVPFALMRRFLQCVLPSWAVAGLLDVGYAKIRHTYSERTIRRWFSAHGIESVQRTRSERYDYKSVLSRLWWGTGWIQLSGFKRR